MKSLVLIEYSLFFMFFGKDGFMVWWFGGFMFYRIIPPERLGTVGIVTLHK
jgi:hypothetical protein